MTFDLWPSTELLYPVILFWILKKDGQIWKTNIFLFQLDMFYKKVKSGTLNINIVLREPGQIEYRFYYWLKLLVISPDYLSLVNFFLHDKIYFFNNQSQFLHFNKFSHHRLVCKIVSFRRKNCLFVYWKLCWLFISNIRRLIKNKHLNHLN